MQLHVEEERKKNGKPRLSLSLFVIDIKVKLGFFLFQASMDLPPDKAKLLKQYDNEKKWDIICDQVSIQPV